MRSKNRENPLEDRANLLKRQSLFKRLHKRNACVLVVGKAAENGRTMRRNEDRKVLLLDEADEEIDESSLEIGMQMNVWLVKEKEVVLIGVDFVCEGQRLNTERDKLGLSAADPPWR